MEILGHCLASTPLLEFKYACVHVCDVGYTTSHSCAQSWAEIVHAYEKKNVYLAECAQQLSRNVNYEVPALKQVLCH